MFLPWQNHGRNIADMGIIPIYLTERQVCVLVGMEALALSLPPPLSSVNLMRIERLSFHIRNAKLVPIVSRLLYQVSCFCGKYRKPIDDIKLKIKHSVEQTDKGTYYFSPNT